MADALPGAPEASQAAPDHAGGLQHSRGAETPQIAPQGPPRSSGAKLRARIATNVEVAASGCHLWTGRLNERGRPILVVGGRKRRVHRLVLELDGSLPPGMDVHHRCRERRCVRPDHLETITHAAHTRLHAEARGAPRRAEIAARASHERWHRRRGVLVPGCRHCDERRRALDLADVSASTRAGAP
jgi:hypothetical protein